MTNFPKKRDIFQSIWYFFCFLINILLVKTLLLSIFSCYDNSLLSKTYGIKESERKRKFHISFFNKIFPFLMILSLFFLMFFFFILLNCSSQQHIYVYIKNIIFIANEMFKQNTFLR